MNSTAAAIELLEEATLLRLFAHPRLSSRTLYQLRPKANVARSAAPICSRGRPAAVSTVGAGSTSTRRPSRKATGPRGLLFASSTRRPSRKATGPRGLLFTIAIVLGFTLRLGRALERYWRPSALGVTRSPRNEPASPVGLLRAVWRVDSPEWCRTAATVCGLFGHYAAVAAEVGVVNDQCDTPSFLP